MINMIGNDISSPRSVILTINRTAINCNLINSATPTHTISTMLTPTPSPSPPTRLEDIVSFFSLYQHEHCTIYCTKNVPQFTCILCLSVCPQIDASPVTGLKLLLQLPPNTVNNTQRLSLLTRAFSAVSSSAMAISTEFVEVHKNQHPLLHTKYQ